ncbi:MAG: Gldg family protein [Planctomycetota bacterium]
MNDQPTPDTDAPAPPPSQATRRLRIGLNVAVAALAALGVVIVLNMLVAYSVRNAGASVKSLVRYDLTATRRYSLSPQTRQVLDGLDENIVIVRLFSARGVEEVQRVIDLIDEYAQYSPRITVEDVDPTLSVAAEERLGQRVVTTLADDIAPLQAAIDEARVATDVLAEAFTEIAALLQANADEGGLGEGAAGQVNQFLLTRLAGYAEEIAVVDERLAARLDQPLPELGLVKTGLSSTLGGLAEGQIPQAVQVLEAAVRDPEAPAAAKDRFLRAATLMTEAGEAATAAATALNDAPDATDYNRVATTLRGQEAVAIIGPSEVRALAIDELYRAIDEETVDEIGRPELGFIGEERITGAIAAMQWDAPPLAVFVYDQSPATGPGGNYNRVAARLSAAGFVVEQWSPRGQQMPGQFGMPGQSIPVPAPEPDPGQPAVWIVLPPDPTPSQNPMAGLDGSQRPPVADLLARRLAQGDAAMLLFAANPGAAFGQADPVLDLLVDRFGVEPRLDELVARTQPTPNRDDQTVYQFSVTQWPDASPIDGALRGLPAVFSVASPIDAAEVEGVTHTPLVELTSPRMWLVDDFTSMQTLQLAEFDPEKAIDDVTIALAATIDPSDEAPAQRVLAIADAAWATDYITSFGNLGPGTADLVGATFPGNGELFVNAVYWLAGTDELIAATPRSQDIRRVGAISPAAGRFVGVLLLIGLPLLAASVGVAVAVARRAG